MTTSPNPEFFLPREAKYCSKTYAGFGHSTWLHRVLPSSMSENFHMPQLDYVQHLPLQDHPTAIAVKNVQAGEVLDQGLSSQLI